MDISDKNSVQYLSSGDAVQSPQVAEGARARGTVSCLHLRSRRGVNCLIIMDGFSPLSNYGKETTKKKRPGAERCKVHWSLSGSTGSLAPASKNTCPSAVACFFSLNSIDRRMMRCNSGMGNFKRSSLAEYSSYGPSRRSLYSFPLIPHSHQA